MLFSVLAAVAVAARPVLGGYLITVTDWRRVFLINAPFEVVALVLAARLLRGALPAEQPPARTPA